MLRYQNRPPRRSRPKPEVKTAIRPAPKWWQIRAEAAPNFMLTLLAVVTLARLASAAITNPPPVAVPGDIIKMDTSRWMMLYDTIPAREVASPWAKPGVACTLDILLMSHEGGALSILAVRPDGVMLSWAGGPTETGAQACHAGEGGLLVPAADYSGLVAKPVPRR